MNPSIPYTITSSLSPDKVQELAGYGRDFACSNGLLQRTPEQPTSSQVVEHIPFTLFPSHFPRRLYKKAMQLQTSVNELYYKVANDDEFLRKALKGTADVDDFVGKQWSIYEAVNKLDRKQDIQLGLLRSDYMLDLYKSCDLDLSLVEVNTMSAASPGLSLLTSQTHRYILRLCGFDESSVERVQRSESCRGYAHAIIAAWKAYDVPGSVIVMLVDNDETNIFDQLNLQRKIYEFEPRIKFWKRTMTDMGERARLLDDGCLMLDGCEVAVVYFRTGYTPAKFRSKKDWNAVRLANLSKAVVSPSISLHLAGAKKVQQELSRPGALERFIDDPDTIQTMRSTFARMYPLDLTDEGDEAATKAIQNPTKYVMKPQREGGGNNIYGLNIKEKLEELSKSHERGAYILMDRIRPPISRNCVVRRNTPLTPYNVSNEFGIYGTFLWHCGDMKINDACGYLLRTKNALCDEGGIASGCAFADSVYIIDDEDIFTKNLIENYPW